MSLPINYTWDDIFKIATGIPEGTQNWIRINFKVPKLVSEQAQLKSATQILFDHSINTMDLNDSFVSQLLHAMERYAEQFDDQNPSEQEQDELWEMVKAHMMGVNFWELDKAISQLKESYHITRKTIKT